LRATGSRRLRTPGVLRRAGLGRGKVGTVHSRIRYSPSPALTGTLSHKWERGSIVMRFKYV